QPGGAGSRSLAADAMVMRATAAATRGDRLMAQGIDVWRSECHPTNRVFAGELRGERFTLAYFAPNRCRDQLPKRPVVQSHEIALSFHREMADASRELVGPDITAAVTLERYPRFIKGGFQDYEGLGIKRSTADSKHVPSLRSRLLGNKVFWSLPQKVVEFLELSGASGDHSKLRP